MGEAIYPLLGRLEREGLVDTHRAASNGGPPRKYYRVSHKGQRQLAAGVSEWRAAILLAVGVVGILPSSLLWTSWARTRPPIAPA